MKSCSFLIPTFNNLPVLHECLPSVVDQVSARGGIDEIIILDNAGSDGSADFVRSTFPSVKVIRFDTNRAIFALNDGARAASHEHLFFLNDDMILLPGCTDALLDAFDSPDVFAATGKVYQWDGRTVQAARRRPAFSHGWFWYLAHTSPDSFGISLHALGGQSIFNRAKFLELGGIDELFSPFYHEDLDVSWRALRHGWRIVFNPHAEMIHKGAATAGRMFTKLQIDTIMRKNMFLFIWKNIHDPAMTHSHLFWLAPRLAQAAAKGDSAFVKGYFDALKQLPEARKARHACRSTALSDSDVFALFAADDEDPDLK